MVLGIAQDGGHPQAGCGRSCCAEAWEDPSQGHRVTCLGIVHPASSAAWIIDATPDFKDQLHKMQGHSLGAEMPQLSGIFLTHGHMGHYIGIMQLGREAMGAKKVPVYAMPRMKEFLAWHSPWSDLAGWGHVELRLLTDGKAVGLGADLTITPFLVPHRGEFSETVGYRVDGPNRSALHIPDIDSWEEWGVPLAEVVSGVDRAYLDGTFFDDGELPGRDMSNVPHPLIRHTMDRLGGLHPDVRSRVRFIHLNHTNPALRSGTEARKRVHAEGFRIAEEGERFEL
jgi:pyrroloquinoline quinone biosynthesis protein B